MALLSSKAVRVSRARLTGGDLIPWRARPASSSPAVPGWAMASAALSPVVMIQGWLAAEALPPPSYSPARRTISGLAGLGGTDRWIMTSALFVVGAGYFVTAAGLPGVRVPARIVLMVAGLSSIGIAVSPEPVRGSTPQHLAWTSLGAVAITVWPAFTARRAPSQPLILRARGAGAVTAVFLALLAWVVFETQGGTALGLAERLVSAVQVTWPFVVALALRRAADQAAPSALGRAAADGTQAGSWGDVLVDGGAADAEQPGDGGDGVVRPVSRSRARRICSAVMADGRPIPRALTNPLPEPSSGHRLREGQSGRAERRPGARTGASALVHPV